jgi:hypothetical protein
VGFDKTKKRRSKIRRNLNLRSRILIFWDGTNIA